MRALIKAPEPENEEIQKQVQPRSLFFFFFLNRVSMCVSQQISTNYELLVHHPTKCELGLFKRRIKEKKSFKNVREERYTAVGSLELAVGFYIGCC